jgi:peptidoglycan/LPS O-acetylase OafA/YrhL
MNTASPGQATAAATRLNPARRLGWIDNLRTSMILLVVSLHATITYSHVGGWYINLPPDPPIETKIVFFLGEMHLQAFFMGLLFFVAGYFAAKSLQRRGVGAFLRERAIRLGIPLFLYVTVIHPFIVYVINPWDAKFPPLGQAYVEYFRSGRFVSATGPLWFVEALLIFSIVLALASSSSKPLNPSISERPPQPKTVYLLALAAVLATATFAVRTVQPIGKNIQNLQLCFFPQYIAAFGLGAWLARRGCTLDDVAQSSVAKRAGWLALVCSPIVLGIILICMRSNIRPGVEPPYSGGWNSFAAAYATWEQFAGVGLALGVMAGVRRFWPNQTALSEWLSARSFGVYVLHPPVIIALAVLFKGYSANPFLNAIVLSITGIIGSYLIADLAHRIRWLRDVI